LKKHTTPEVYDFLQRLCITIPQRLERFGNALAALQSASTLKEIAIAYDEAKASREELLIFISSLDGFAKIFDPLETFATEKQRQLTKQMVQALADAALKKPQTNTQEPDSAA
jgi:hypothetical protein